MPQVEIIFEDNHLLVIDKPAGLLSQENIVVWAKSYLKETYHKPGLVYVGLVHRLDRNTSGVMVLARTSKAAERLSAAIRKGALDKRYLAVVDGIVDARGELVHHLAAREGERGMRVAEAGQEARLSFKRIALGQAASLIAIQLHTGRKHQIRVQLAAAGHPIVGDRLYGRASAAIARPALHAAVLRFEHPVRKEPVEFRAPLPVDMSRCLLTLKIDLPSPLPL